MSVTANNIGELSYGSFYLPTLAFGFLASQSNNPLFQFIPRYTFHSITVEPVFLLYFLTAFSFLGAIVGHGVGRAIYGPGGPSSRPKQNTVQVQHTLAIILGEDPADIPLVPCRIAAEGILQDVREYLRLQKTQWWYDHWASTAQQRRFDRLAGPIPRGHRLEDGYVQLVEMQKEFFSLDRLPRILYFVPMALQKHTSWLALVTLLGYAYLGNPTYIVLLLAFALIVLLLRPVFWAPIPGYTNVEALEDRFTAEYKRIEEKEDEFRA